MEKSILKLDKKNILAVTRVHSLVIGSGAAGHGCRPRGRRESA